MATIVPFESKFRTRLAERRQEHEEEEDVLWAIKRLEASGKFGQEALRYLIMRCCYEPALVIPFEWAAFLKKDGLMETGGGITEVVKSAVRRRQHGAWGPRAPVVRLRC